mgnify:CR=1 FL=1
MCSSDLEDVRLHAGEPGDFPDFEVELVGDVGRRHEDRLIYAVSYFDGFAHALRIIMAQCGALHTEGCAAEGNGRH